MLPLLVNTIRSASILADRLPCPLCCIAPQPNNNRVASTIACFSSSTD